MNNDQIIWNYLMKKYNNPYGVAALMGNLFVESRLNPELAESSKIKKLGISSSEYIRRIDHGLYTKEEFAHDGIGFGLAQWTYWTRKQNLYDYVKKMSLSIADNEAQLAFLYKEISESYKTVHNAILNATDVRSCSDVIVKRYEKPKNQTESFLENRAKYGRGYFDKFYTNQSNNESAPTKKQKYVVATANVNVRVGNGKDYAKETVLLKGGRVPYVAESENGWYAVEFKKFEKKVLWISKEYSKLEEV